MPEQAGLEESEEEIDDDEEFEHDDFESDEGSDDEVLVQRKTLERSMRETAELREQLEEVRRTLQEEAERSAAHNTQPVTSTAPSKPDVPTIKPTPEPAPAPTPEPAPAPTPEPMPAPLTSTPAPEPMPAPLTSTPTPEPMPAPALAPAPTPEPNPTTPAAPATVPAPVPVAKADLAKQKAGMATKPAKTKKAAVALAPASEAPSVGAPNGKAAKGGKRAGKTPPEKLLQTVAAGKGIRCCLKVGGSVWTGERNDVISIREIKSGALQSAIDLQRQLAWCMLVVGAEVWVGTQDGVIYVFSTMSPRDPLRELRAHCGGVYCLVSSTVSECLAFSGSNDFTCYAWGAATAGTLFSGHTGGVRCALSLGGSLFTGSDDHDIRCWNASTAECVATLSAHSKSVLTLSTASGLLFSAGDDGKIIVWPLRPNAQGWSPLLETRTDASHPKLSVLQLQPVGPHLWSGASDGCTRIWQLPTASEVEAGGGLKLKLLRTLREKHGAGHQALVAMNYVQRRLVWSVALDGSTAAMLWQQELGDGVDESEALGLALAERESARHLAELSQSRLDAASSDAARSAAELETALAEIASLRAALADKTIEASHLRTGLTEADTELAAEREETRRLRAELESVRTQAEEQRRVRDAQIENLRATCADLSSRLDGSDRARARLEEEFTLCRGELASADERICKTEAALQEERARRAEGERQLEALRAELAKEKAEVARLLGLSEQIGAKLKEMEDALAAERARAGSREDSISSLEAKLVELREALQKEVQRAFAAEQLAADLTAKLAVMTTGAQLQRKRAERAEEREAVLQAKLQASDYFKLDIIARELKKIDESLRKTRSDVAPLQKFLKSIKQPDETQTAEQALAHPRIVYISMPRPMPRTRAEFASDLHCGCCRRSRRPSSRWGGAVATFVTSSSSA